MSLLIQIKWKIYTECRGDMTLYSIKETHYNNNKITPLHNRYIGIPGILVLVIRLRGVG